MPAAVSTSRRAAVTSLAAYQESLSSGDQWAVSLPARPRCASGPASSSTLLATAEGVGYRSP